MDKERQILERHGYVWKEFQTDSPIQRRKYYTPDGREMVLPADAYSLNHYLDKGFTLVPPAKEELPTTGESSQTEGDNGQVRNVAQPKKTRRKKRKYRRKIKKEVEK